MTSALGILEEPRQARVTFQGFQMVTQKSYELCLQVGLGCFDCAFRKAERRRDCESRAWCNNCYINTPKPFLAGVAASAVEPSLVVAQTFQLVIAHNAALHLIADKTNIHKDWV
eukprot:4790428-Amphidinium_carterae.1